MRYLAQRFLVQRRVAHRVRGPRFEVRRFLVSSIAAMFIAGCAAPGAPTPIASTHRLVDVGGSSLYVESVGSGSPIVFLHGGLHHFDNTFARQRDDFARSHTVIGIDQRGHGHSPDDARSYSYDEMAEDTAAVIRQLGRGPVDVVGHSDGGDVALKLARAHPELVRRIVVSGANLRAGLPPEELQRRSAWSAEQLAAFLPDFEKRMPPSFRTDHIAVNPEGADHWNVLLAKSYRLWLRPVVITADDLKAIQAPVLVVAGDKDFTSLEETAEIQRGLRKGQLFIVPGSGHATFSDRPELVDLAIREFLDKP